MTLSLVCKIFDFVMVFASSLTKHPTYFTAHSLTSFLAVSLFFEDIHQFKISVASPLYAKNWCHRIFPCGFSGSKINLRNSPKRKRFLLRRSNTSSTSSASFLAANSRASSCCRAMVLFCFLMALLRRMICFSSLVPVTGVLQAGPSVSRGGKESSESEGTLTSSISGTIGCGGDRAWLRLSK